MAAAGAYVIVSPGGEEQAVQQVGTATPVATNTPSTPAATPGRSNASLPGGYEFFYPPSWNQVLLSDDPYIGKFYLAPTPEPAEKDIPELEVFVYGNPEQVALEEFFDGRERANLFEEAAGGYRPFSADGASGYWFDNVVGFTNYTVVALSSGGFVYQFSDPQKHQADGVFLQVVLSFSRVQG